MENESPPYEAEYAKSSRAKCKRCLSLIAKDSLRLAIMVQSIHFDGKQPHWYHYSCFFGKCRPLSIDEIGHFHALRWEDQKKIQEQIERRGGGKGSAEGGVRLVSKSLKDFVVQYALSSRSACKKCEQKIEKDEIRISHKEMDSEKPHLGLIDRWHHVGCFVKRRKEFGWKDGEFTADSLTGFKALDPEDKNTIKKLLDKKGKKSKKVIALKEVSTNSIKQEVEADGPSKVNGNTLKLQKQSSLLWKCIDTLKKLELKKTELIDILQKNKQDVPKGLDKLYERIADGMIFGRLGPCTLCGGQLVASDRGFYQCIGDISAWTKCTNTTLDVKREPWVIPNEVKELSPYLSKYKFKPQDRVFPPMASVKPLKDKKIVLLGKLTKSQDEMKEVVEKLGGNVTSSMAKAYCVISSKETVAKKGNKKITSAELKDLFVVSEEFLEECSQIKLPGQSLLPLLRKFNLVSWGSEGEVFDGKSNKRMLENVASKGESSKKIKLMVKHGAAVDPESSLEGCCDVLVHQGKKYTATLSLVDMKSGANSYYKLQCLQEHSGRRWHVFRSWGRVGTVIGGTKVEKFHHLEAARTNFLDLYVEKTGNYFLANSFEKYPHKFYPLDIDYGEDDKNKIVNLTNAGTKSKLEAEIQNLVKLIFDIESMKKAMLEFELDLNKMPLGKLSKKQMQMAFSVLTEATQLIDKGELTGAIMLDCSNRFYTLIPHDYGMHQPPLLDNSAIIKAKTQMLDNLMDIEVAYNLLKSGEGNEVEEDPLDASYKKLQCHIEVVAKESEEFNLVKKYVELSHASTHNQYTLTVEELFKLDRHGESTRFRPFKAMHNRHLLWHGSRTTNYAGILSQGLRIAPPEAPVTGYMFGKGIYFADMVSKSMNYCGATASNPIGLGLLADVALGNMHELTDAKNIKRLPKAKHSVKGVGQTEPDQSTHISRDGVLWPMGKGVQADLSKHKDNKTSLLYNEFIVYDIAQVHLKYLVKFKFDYKSLW